MKLEKMHGQLVGRVCFVNATFRYRQQLGPSG
jgi:hypothetical protein